MEEREALSLANLKGGAAIEMFDRALAEVLTNINDINTTLKAREINLKVTLVPSEDRTLLGIRLECTRKLTGQEPEKVTADIRFDQRGRAVAYEREQKQRGLFPDNAIPLKGGSQND